MHHINFRHIPVISELSEHTAGNDTGRKRPSVCRVQEKFFRFDIEFLLWIGGPENTCQESPETFRSIGGGVSIEEQE